MGKRKEGNDVRKLEIRIRASASQQSFTCKRKVEIPTEWIITHRGCSKLNYDASRSAFQSKMCPTKNNNETNQQSVQRVKDIHCLLNMKVAKVKTMNKMKVALGGRLMTGDSVKSTCKGVQQLCNDSDGVAFTQPCNISSKETSVGKVLCCKNSLFCLSYPPYRE